MRKAFNFLLLWLVLFLAFQAFACKSVQKGAKEEPGETAVTTSQTNTVATGKAIAGSTTTSQRRAGSTATGQKKAGSNQTSKTNAGSDETGKSKQETLAELKDEVIAGVEKLINPQVKKALLPSGVGLLILISLLSSKNEKPRKNVRH
jgi:type IV secretory pathway TrbL component